MNYSSIKSTLLLAALWLCCLHGEAQQMQASLSHYSTDNGLASNAISHMTQDDYGYIWIATWNGLSRFDGYHFYNYQTGAASRIPHLHNRIHSLAIDSQQNVWLRMYDNRVFVLRRSTDCLEDPFEGVAGGEDFHTNYPITVTSSGYVLVNIEGTGLYKLRMEQQGVARELITTGGLNVTSMAEGYQNDIWLGTNQGVHRMDLSNLNIERKGLFLDESITCLYSNGYNIYAGTESGKILSFSYGQAPTTIRHGGEPVNAVFVDSHGIIWYSDERMGAAHIKPDGSTREFSQQVVVPDYDGRGGVFSETNGTVWVRMNHGGYGYYNRETDEVEYFHNDPSNPWNLSNTVNASLELREGVVWESTSRRGLEKLELLKNTIERIQLYPDQGPTMANEIRTMLYDNRQQLLVLGNKAGQLFFIRSDGSRTMLTHDSKGHPFGRTYGISRDSKGNYLLCSKDNGLFIITPRQGGDYFIENLRHSDQNEWSMNHNGAYTAIDDGQGNIWVATYGGGVNLITKNNSGQWVAMHRQNQMRKYPTTSHQKVRTLALDREGNVWAGTTDGILIMSYKDKKLSIRPLEQSESEPDRILMSNDVVCLAQDALGSMWVGTNGGGLAHTTGQDADGRWLFENFGSADGLPSEEIRSITFDNRGNAWFATDHVICSFDVGKKIFTTFSSLDGVDETMCSEGAAITMPNGNVLFGTLNGYYLVDRTKLMNSAGNVLKLRITDFWLNDEPQSPRLSDNFDYYVPDSRHVKLPGHGAVVKLRFASLNYQLQHRVHYQYMLEGYDTEWRNADKSRTASYGSLPTGTFHFRVKAFLLESPEKYDLRQIEIVVPPYFMLSSAAIWVYMPLAALLAIWLMFWRQNWLARMQEEKDNSHFL